MITTEDIRAAAEVVAARIVKQSLTPDEARQANIALRLTRKVGDVWYYKNEPVESVDDPAFKKIVRGVAAASIMPTGIVVGGIRFRYRA